MTQLNTPYPATAYLTGFLRKVGAKTGYEVDQKDPALELVLRLFSPNGLQRIREKISERIGSKKPKLAPSVESFLKQFDRHVAVSSAVIAFLQGKDSSLALRITSRRYLPEGPRFQSLEQYEDLNWAFGGLGIQDHAKHLATLWIDDLADVVRDGVDERFELARYAEKLAASQPSFDPLAKALSEKPSLVDEVLLEITAEYFKNPPQILGLTAPFPGNIYGALRMAQWVKKHHPECIVILGGGYANTELRSLKEKRLFEFIDYVVLDDGERPLTNLLEYLQGKRPRKELVRTYTLSEDRKSLEYIHDTSQKDIPHGETGTPTYDGLALDQYLSLMEMLNPMHRIWSDGRWNKVTLAHGCYWGKCAFCDVTLDYIERYDPASADRVIDRMVSLIEETGQRGFHFVDEACPPALLKNIARRLIDRQIQVTWWGNIRFEKAFTPELCQLLADSGCVAVSGGLEVASDRLLKLMNKGVTVEQVARVTNAFTEAGVMVHAYLMYGFPTQTAQETIDALERVRQLFAAGCIQSAYWHRFVATVHSLVGKDPQKFGLKVLPAPEVQFAENDLPVEDPTGVDHDALGMGLRKALYNYMHGIGLEDDVRVWFKDVFPRTKVAKSTVAPNLIQGALDRDGPTS